MVESKKEDSSTAKAEKKNSASDEFGKEFLSSWKSMSVAEDDGLDFNKDEAPKGKKKAFNFDNLDMDFSFDGDFGKKSSSFKVDMSDLDFSSPPKKAPPPKEKATEEPPSGKQGGKQSRFTFDFDFNELDSFDFGSSMTKGEKKSEKAADTKTFDSPRKEEKVQPASSKPVASMGASEDSNTDKQPRTQQASTSRFEHLKYDSINTSPSTSMNFGNSSPSRSTAVSLEKEVSVNAKETYQCSQLSKKADSARSLSMEGSGQDGGPDTQGEVCSSSTMQKAEPEEAVDVSVKLPELESSPVRHVSGPKTTRNECDKTLGNQSDTYTGDTPKDESMQGDAVSDSSDGRFSPKRLHITRPADGNKAKSKLLLAPLRSEPKDLQPTKEKGSGGIQSKYFNRSAENASKLNTPSIAKDVSSVSKKQAENALLNHADAKSEPKSHQIEKDKGSCSTQSKYFKKSAEVGSPLKPQAIPKKVCAVSDKRSENLPSSSADHLSLNRKECGINDTQAANPKVDNSKPHEVAVTKTVGIPVVLGNRKSGDNPEISARFQVHSTQSPKKTVMSTAPQSLNAKLVSSIAAIRNSKINSVEGNKLSPLLASQKTLETSSLKVSRLVIPTDASQSKALTGMKSLKHSESVEKQGLLSPPMKRKMCEAPNADPTTQNPLKYAMPETSERIDNKRVRSSENLLEGFQSSPVLDVPRDGHWKELEVPLLMENDENVEKAEAYSKELEDICNMLKKKHEEAKELLVRAVVNHNNLLMLNHPIYEDKIRMVQKFATLMLSPRHPC